MTVSSELSFWSSLFRVSMSPELQLINLKNLTLSLFVWPQHVSHQLHGFLFKVQMNTITITMMKEDMNQSAHVLFYVSWDIVVNCICMPLMIVFIHNLSSCNIIITVRIKYEIMTKYKSKIMTKNS